MQASAAANSQAWAAAEAILTGRLNDAEGSAAAAGEREKRAWEKVQAANTRLAASAAALDALKTELADADSGDCVSDYQCCIPIDGFTGSMRNAVSSHCPDALPALSLQIALWADASSQWPMCHKTSRAFPGSCVLYACSDPSEGAICRNGQGTRAATGS